MDEKICTKCGVKRFITEFYWTNDGRIDSWCKECKGKYSTKYNSSIGAKAWRKSERGRLLISRASRRAALKYRFGITQDDYECILKEQNGKCAICGKEQLPYLGVDHCHKTGRVRGLLCNICNRGIGSFKDDCALLENAIKYLRKG